MNSPLLLLHVDVHASAGVTTRSAAGGPHGRTDVAAALVPVAKVVLSAGAV